ncbi:hypothetical protein GCM10009675_49660 [Prauserella alba]|uniref:Secreted protein n=1 Tax=Prauserella alba TaxID=176898 RepID=A0ABP4GGD9_9PSEU
MPTSGSLSRPSCCRAFWDTVCSAKAAPAKSTPTRTATTTSTTVTILRTRRPERGEDDLEGVDTVSLTSGSQSASGGFWRTLETAGCDTSPIHNAHEDTRIVNTALCDARSTCCSFHDL